MRRRLGLLLSNRTSPQPSILIPTSLRLARQNSTTTTPRTMSGPGQGFEYDPQEVNWLQRDVLLFANSIGATADELHLLYVSNRPRGVASRWPATKTSCKGLVATPAPLSLHPLTPPRNSTPSSPCSPRTPSSFVRTPIAEQANSPSVQGHHPGGDRLLRLQVHAGDSRRAQV